jgi:transposase-like protein
MIKRNNFSKDYKEKIVLELVSGQSSVAQVAQREKVNPQTLRNWMAKINSGSFKSENEIEIQLRKRIGELEGALAEMALNNHILKKTEIYLKEMRQKEKLSGSISPTNSVLSGVAKH